MAPIARPRTTDMRFFCASVLIASALAALLVAPDPAAQLTALAMLALGAALSFDG